MNASSGAPTPSIALVALGLILAAALTLTYANHFDNAFQFDDHHTIVSNEFIRDIHNVPRFFTDAQTTSTMPTNQAYRPVVTTLNAIDYWIAGGDEPFVFHLHIFVEFLLLCALLYLLFLAVFDAAIPQRANRWLALFAAALFGFHTASAETINYIIARSDQFSTLCVVAAFVIFVYSKGWRRHLAMIPFLVGIFAKPTTLMFAPLLVAYIALIERPSLLVAAEPARISSQIARVARATGAYLAVGVVLYFFTRSMFSASWTPSTTSALDYLTTQPYVIWIYLKTFVVPLELTADTDIPVIRQVTDSRALFGLVVILACLTLAWATARQRATLPVAFGIVWFFVALAPSSSLVPLSEVMNHHRTFFPYIGLVMSSVWLLGLGYRRLARVRGVRALAIAWAALLLSVHAHGTYLRNEVWDSEESLWHDVTLKSPSNGRGLMNYGLTQFRRGDVDTALEYYERALGTTYRHHAFLHVNLALAYARKGRHDLAEQAFLTAIENGRGYPVSHYYYARWLYQRGRQEQARDHVAKALALSPGHAPSLQLNAALTRSPVARAQDEVAAAPSADGYIQLSLEYYRARRFEESVEASTRALELTPSAIAYNNLCSALGALGRWAQAIEACERALEMKPEFERARNNLEWARSQMASSRR